MNDDKPLTLGDFKQLMADHEERESSRFRSAFPDGDAEKHCEFHQAKIDAAKAEQRFWELAQAKAVEKGIEGVFGAIRIVVILALAGLAFKLGIALPFVAGKI